MRHVIVCVILVLSPAASAVLHHNTAPCLELQSGTPLVEQSHRYIWDDHATHVGALRRDSCACQEQAAASLRICCAISVQAQGPTSRERVPRGPSSILAAAFWMAPSSCCSAVTAAPTARFLFRAGKGLDLIYCDKVASSLCCNFQSGEDLVSPGQGASLVDASGLISSG